MRPSWALPFVIRTWLSELASQFPHSFDCPAGFSHLGFVQHLKGQTGQTLYTQLACTLLKSGYIIQPQLLEQRVSEEWGLRFAQSNTARLPLLETVETGEDVHNFHQNTASAC